MEQLLLLIRQSEQLACDIEEAEATSNANENWEERSRLEKELVDIDKELHDLEVCVLHPASFLTLFCICTVLYGGVLANVCIDEARQHASILQN